VFDERNPAVLKLIATVIEAAHARGRKVGICGQAPSDYPEFAQFLVERGIDSISLNPDAVLKTTRAILEMEHAMAARWRGSSVRFARPPSERLHTILDPSGSAMPAC
jgi:pyruvate,water dikinase